MKAHEKKNPFSSGGTREEFVVGITSSGSLALRERDGQPSGLSSEAAAAKEEVLLTKEGSRLLTTSRQVQNQKLGPFTALYLASPCGNN